MSDKIKALLIAGTGAAVIAGAGVLDYLLSKQQVELSELNTHLLYHGLPPEGSLKNARAVWQQHLAEHKEAQDFADIINFNYQD